MVVKFNLSNIIPQNAILKKATLSIFADKHYPGMEGQAKNGAKSLYAITKAWDEVTTTWRRPWSKAGGDFNSSAVAKSNNTQVKVWENYDVTSKIKDFIQSPTSNHGFLLKHDSYRPAKGVTFITSENTNMPNRPKMTLIVEIPTAIKNNAANISANGIKLRYSLGSYAVFIPKSNNTFVEIFSPRGQVISKFSTDKSKEWYVIPNGTSQGVHILHIFNNSVSYTKKISFMK